jgi:hypothetical protein
MDIPVYSGYLKTEIGPIPERSGLNKLDSGRNPK